MPSRPSIQAVSRQARSAVPQLKAAFSSTPSQPAMKEVPSGPTDALLNLDKDDSTRRLPGLDYMTGMLHQRENRSNMRNIREQTLEKAQTQKAREEFTRQLPRKWKVGDIYAPHDLSPAEMLKWRQPKQPSKDILDMVGINPLDEYRNFSIMSEFMTPMGRIKHSSETGLRPVNQRKMAKALRRAIGMGIHPSTHRHPMLIFRETQNAPPQNAAAMPMNTSRQAITVK